jgi:hypothetical protein
MGFHGHFFIQEHRNSAWFSADFYGILRKNKLRDIKYMKWNKA